MKRAIIVFAGLSLIALMGCYDRLYSPKLANAFGATVQIGIKYSDGNVSTAIWSPCHAAYVGKKDLSIEQISVVQDGKEIAVFGLDQLKPMLLVNATRGVEPVWKIGHDGIARLVEECVGC